MNQGRTAESNNNITSKILGKIGELTESLSAASLIVKEVYETHIVAENLSNTVIKLGDVFIPVGVDGEYYQVIKAAKKSVLMPLVGEVNIYPGSRIYHHKKELEPVRSPEELLGRVIDAMGNPIDGLGPLTNQKRRIENKEVTNPMERKRIAEIVETGIKSIDGLLTLGRGQRIGIMAGSGVGKTTTLSMIAKYSTEDINVIALIGERGREVREFIEKELGEEGLKRSVVIVATSDQTPLLQVRAAEYATKIAMDFRDEKKNVLLMMDSITRYLMAKRVIDISSGDIPMMGGRTSSMEPSIQNMLEKAGNNDKGSITGIYTVLVEGEDFETPIPDMVRGILDGHIVLTRELANLNHYPAIDVLSSVSRVMQDIVPEQELVLAREIKKYMSLYKKNEDQILLGLIKPGNNEELDKSIKLKDSIDNFLTQGISENYKRELTIKKIEEVLEKEADN